MKDRRSYIRMSVDIPATAYCPDMEEEYRCTIQNISETGVGLVFSKINPVSLKPDDVIMLQFCDRFMYGGREECPVLTLKMTVRHVEERDNKIHVGCFANNKLFKEYVLKKRSDRIRPEYRKQSLNAV